MRINSITTGWDAYIGCLRRLQNCDNFKPFQNSQSKELFVFFMKFHYVPSKTLERFSIAFTANDKRQAEISRVPKTREISLVSAYILPVSHSYVASTKDREIN